MKGGGGVRWSLKGDDGDPASTISVELDAIGLQ